MYINNMGNRFRNIFIGLSVCGLLATYAADAEVEGSEAIKAYESEGFLNYKLHCGICHSITPPKDVAPPLSQVLEVYHNAYPDSATFVKKVSDWVSHPNKNKTLIPGAIKEHKIMPKLPYDKETIRKISEWMWNATQCPDPPNSSDPQPDLGNC